MTIQTTDIKLYRALTTGQDATAGGYVGTTEVVDGAANNLFPDVSRMDRVYSDVALEKVFLSVRSSNDDTYLGAHAVLIDAPDDVGVGVMLFYTGGDDDTRDDCRTYIESYWLPGDYLEDDAVLKGTMPSGSQSVSIILGHDYLQVDDVLYLEDGGLSEYVRITSVEIVKYGMLSQYEYTVLGLARPLENSYTSACKPRITGADPSWRAYGVTTLAAGVSAGASQIQVTETRQPVAPGSIGSQSVTGEAPWDEAAEDHELAVLWDGLQDAVWPGADASATLYTQAAPVRPGTLTARIEWGGLLWVEIADDGAGGISTSSAGEAGNTIIGTISYATGQLDLEKDFSPGGDGDVAWLRFHRTPTAAGVTRTHSETATTSSLYTPTLSPAQITPGSIVIDYRQGEVWKRVTDDEAGILTGDGAGTIDYTTGACSLTTAGAPDYGAEILYRWRTGFYTQDVQDETLGTGPTTAFTLTNAPLSGSASIELTESTATVTLWDGGDGKLYTERDLLTGTGSDSGTISYTTGDIALTAHTPDAATDVIAREYTYRSAGEHTDSHQLRSQGNPLSSGSLQVIATAASDSSTLTLNDNGSGSLTGDGSGSIDYATGYINPTFSENIQETSLVLHYSYETTVTPDPEILGLDTQALPADGKVGIFHSGGVALIREGAAEDLLLISDISGDTLTLGGVTTNTYTTAATVSPVLQLGDLQARMIDQWSLESWDGTWSDTPGTPSGWTYDFTGHPLTIQNNGGTADRWSVKFTSATDFEIHSEREGLIGTGDTSTDCSPNNSQTSTPYFTLAAAGWPGSGIQYGHALRINTDDAAAPIWVARIVAAGTNAVSSDSATIEMRGDEDA
ncbi:MAG: hypothetical protein HQL52_03930 [Magnetococcales bacterium]|nr:hypothetical protein [Magnetococcales bacterium]